LTGRKRQFKTIGFLVLLSISLIFPFIQNNFDISYEENRDTDFVKTSAQRLVTEQWINNSIFESPIEPEWYWENGTEGDNSDMDATTSDEQANFEVLGETKSFSVTSGTINSSSWYGWNIFNNGDFLAPGTTAINESGCYTYHFLNESTGPGQVNNFPSVHFKKNVSMPDEMSDYIITDVSLEVTFNASVDINVDSFNDWDPTANTAYIDMDKFEIGDSANFYTEFSDLNNSYPFRVANFETREVALGQGDRWHEDILNITNTELNYVDKQDLIANLNTALEGDQQNFAITLGLEVYCEDNKAATGGDQDEWKYLIFKSVNLTITYVKKIDQFTTTSWNQVGNTLDSASAQVTDAKFFFKYKVNNTWPSSAPLSEIKFYINDKSYDEGILKLTSANTSWQEAMVGGFDVTSLISTDVPITVSIEVFLKDTFELGQGISISIDDVYLNITYIETFPDYGTDLELYLDDEDKTLDPVIQIPIDHMLNITVTYKDNVSANHLFADSYTLEGKVSGPLTENSTFEQYYFIVNSTELGLGSSVLTVTLQKTNYESQFIQILVEVVERATQLELNIENSQINESDTFFSQYDEYLDISVNYTDDLSSAHVDGASVDILGIGSMDENANQYNFTLNTNNLTQGVNVLTIFAQKNNYKSQTIQFFISIQIRATNIICYVDGNKTADGDTVYSQFDVSLNVTVLFRDSETDTHLTGASVELLGGLLGTFDDSGSQFNYTIKTNDLEKVNILTIFAQLDGYQPQTVQFFINVKERATDLFLFVDGDPINQGDTIEFEANELINITVFYKDDLTDAHLSGANVELLGFDSLDDINSQFNITINSDNLTEEVNILTIFAQLSNYQPKPIQFVIKVIDRYTEIQLLINGTAPVDPILEIPIGTIINITVKFYDHQTGLEIPNAWLQLFIETLTINFTENPIHNQYTIILNRLELSLGEKQLTIVAQAPTYQTNTTGIKINVIPVKTLINTVSGLNYVDMSPNEDFLIQVNLTNTDFGGNVKNATVTYRWANGQGFLTDSNDDGVYEATVNNVPTGTYRISINAYAGEDYDFSDDFEIILNVVAPPGPDITIILISLAAGLVGLTTAFVLYQRHFKYPPKVRMMRKVRKKISKGKKLKPLTVYTRDNIITTELERNKEILKVEKEIVDKINKKPGGETLE